MKKWRCKICGYVHEGENPPDKCPVCGVSEDQFVLMND
jgi:rubrerythrin